MPTTDRTQLHPVVLEYGDMMRGYAEVAGLGKPQLIVLPFLTPTIASLWVGTVTPIPPGLARPLIESLECDAVMHDHDVDTIIPRPRDGLIDYDSAVALALARPARGLAGPRGRRCWRHPRICCPRSRTGPGRSTSSTTAPNAATPPERSLEGCTQQSCCRRALVVVSACGAEAEPPALDHRHSRASPSSAAARRRANSGPRMAAGGGTPVPPNSSPKNQPTACSPVHGQWESKVPVFAAELVRRRAFPLQEHPGELHFTSALLS